MDIHTAYVKHTAYSGYDNISCCFLGAFSHVEDALEAIKNDSKDKVNFLKGLEGIDGHPLYTDDNLCLTNEYEDWYIELLVGDDEKYEWFVVSSALDKPTYDEL